PVSHVCCILAGVEGAVIIDIAAQACCCTYPHPCCATMPHSTVHASSAHASPPLRRTAIAGVLMPTFVSCPPHSAPRSGGLPVIASPHAPQQHCRRTSLGISSARAITPRHTATASASIP